MLIWGFGGQWSGHTACTPLLKRGAERWINRCVLRGWHADLGFRGERAGTAVVLRSVGGRLGPQELGSGVPSAPAAYSRRPVGETVILMTPPFYPY